MKSFFFWRKLKHRFFLEPENYYYNRRERNVYVIFAGFILPITYTFTVFIIRIWCRVPIAINSQIHRRHTTNEPFWNRRMHCTFRISVVIPHIDICFAFEHVCLVLFLSLSFPSDFNSVALIFFSNLFIIYFDCNWWSEQPMKKKKKR